MVGSQGANMSTLSSLYDGNPTGLKSWLENNRLNGFADLPQAERLFALEYTKTGDRFEAGRVSGIAANRTLRTLREPLVQEFIQYLNEQKQHYSLIDASFIEVQYLTLYGRLMGEEEVAVLDKEGFVQMRHKFHASESVSALRDMAKMAGVYKDDPAVNVNINGVGPAELTADQKDTLDKVLDGKF